MHRIAVIGAVYSETCGMPLHALSIGDSGDGNILEMVGGGARNIACNLRLLGEEVFLITAVGDDTESFAVMDSCEQFGLNTDYAVSVSGEKMPRRMLVSSTNGDQEIAVYDRHALRALNQDFFLAHCMEILQDVDAVVLDGDLPEDGIRFLAETCHIPLYCDPGSPENISRLRPYLSRFHAIKPDLEEAFTLGGSRERDTAAERILQLGPDKLFISQAANGMFARTKDGASVHCPCKPAYLENSRGVGDAMTAAIVWADLSGFSLRQTVECAMRAASLTASCRENINPDLSSSKLLSA